jgi:hypothetical protein
LVTLDGQDTSNCILKHLIAKATYNLGNNHSCLKPKNIEKS